LTNPTLPTSVDWLRWHFDGAPLAVTVDGAIVTSTSTPTSTSPSAASTHRRRRWRH